MFGNPSLEAGEEAAEAIFHTHRHIREFRKALIETYRDRVHELSAFSPDVPRESAKLNEKTKSAFQESWDNFNHGVGADDERKARYWGASLGEFLAGIDAGIVRNPAVDEADILRNTSYLTDAIRDFGFAQKFFALVRDRLERILHKGSSKMSNVQISLLQRMVRLLT